MSSFEQTMMGWSPGCYIPSFVKIGPSVPNKKFLVGFYHLSAWWPLGHMTSIILSEFHFLVPESFHTKFSSDRHSSFLENQV